jgi:RHS repeat-associated protein
MQFFCSQLSVAQCVYSTSPSSISLPGTGGGDYISVSSGSCESWYAYTNDSWIYIWEDWYESLVSVYADPNHEGYRTGTVIIHDSWTDEEFAVSISQDIGCDQLPSPGDITGPSIVCAGGYAIFSISPVEGATFYHWAVNGNSVYNAYDTVATISFNSYTQDPVITAAAYNECGEGIQSSKQITNHFAPTPGSISGTQSIPYNTAPATLLNTTSASNSMGTNHYQWQSSHSEIHNWTNIQGATDSVYSPGVMISPTFYRRAATDNCGTSYSNEIKISMIFPEVGYLIGSQIINAETRVIDTINLVGTKNGSFNVNTIGAATYSIPIEVPQGINGIAPGISLEYSSTNGPGVAGYGWQISGISNITRGPSTYYHDGFVRGIKLDTDDKFYLDGQRLVRTGESFENTYQTEVDIFSRVSQKDTWGPGWFSAETKSGLTYEYGNSETSQYRINNHVQIVGWFVSSISDKFNNHIDYEYINDNNIIYLTTITYGPNKIFFNYKQRSDVAVNFLLGEEIQQQLILDKIEITYNSTVIKTYQLEYIHQVSSYNFSSVLNTITEYGLNGSGFNSTVFSYYYPEAVSSWRGQQREESILMNSDKIIIPGDFTGDGKDDFLCIPGSGDTMSISYDFPTGLYEKPEYFIEDDYYNVSRISTENLDDARVLDLNGDGREDLIYQYRESCFYYRLSGPNTLSEPVQVSTIPNNATAGLSGRKLRKYMWYAYDNEFIESDYNGDGIQDIFICDDPGKWEILSFVNPSGQIGTSFYSKASGTDSNLSNDGDILSADFDGDGKTDIWSFQSTGLKIYSLVGQSMNLIYSDITIDKFNFYLLGDFNGDGKADILVYGDGKYGTEIDYQQWQIRLSTGTGFHFNYINQKYANLKDKRHRVGDFNGDGATDLVIIDPGNWWKYLYAQNYGEGFYEKDEDDPYRIIMGMEVPLNGIPQMYLNDYNGDGATDILITGPYSPNENGYIIYKGGVNTKVLLKAVSNGLGSLAKVEYTLHLNNRDYNIAYPVSDYVGSLKTVSKVFYDNGKGSLNTQSYIFSGAKVHLLGKGFLYFSRIETKDDLTNIRDISTFGYDATYFYPKLINSYKVRSTSDTISKVVNLWSHHVLDPSKKRIFPYLQSSVQSDMKTGNSLTINTSYDNYGNPTLITKSYNNGTSKTDSVTYNNIVSPSLWLLGRPASTTVRYTDNDTTIIRSGTKVFNQANNLLTSETWLPGTSNQITNTYQYNSFGSLVSETATVNSIPRSKSITYESDNIRVHSTLDQLSHVTTNSYDTYGKLESVQDYLNNTVTYEYDDMGRTETVSSSDNSETNTCYAWEDPTSAPLLARYSVLKTSNNGLYAKNWYDKLGREIRSGVNGFDGTLIYTSTKYNTIGQIDSISEPYYPTDTPLWNTFSYDNYGRKITYSRPSGRNSSWQYTNNTIIETTADRSFTKVFSGDGTISSSTDEGGTLIYTYYPDGKPETITAPGGIITRMRYDAAGNQIQLSDPSAGTLEYSYNGYGELTGQINSRDQVTSVNYNPEGTISQKVTPEGTTLYTYNSNKQLTGISSQESGVSRSFVYNNTGKITSTTEAISGSSFTTSFTYDGLGRISTITHPSGITETKNYNANGYLSSVTAGGNVCWTVTSMNAKQQITEGQFRNNLNVTNGYDVYGFPTSINASTTTDTIQDYSFNFNPTTGNLNWRKNNKYESLHEDFNYDDLDRLINIYMDTTMTLNLEYHNNKGGITVKTDVGVLHYDIASNPYAVSSIDPSTGLIQSPDSITWTSFEKARIISENGDSAYFVYDSDNERARMIIRHNDSTVLVRWYPSDNYIKEISEDNTREYTFIGGDAYTANVVAITQNNTTIYYNLLRDHLGNITHVVNSENNNLVAEYSYDAWGRMRNPSTWENFPPDSVPELIVAGRGFTGHEHLPWFNLINMNGRLYDPLIGQFLSPDNYIQNSSSSQAYNRYAYCLNNPLIYTDPSGEILLWLIYQLGVGALTTADNMVNKNMNFTDAVKHSSFTYSRSFTFNSPKNLYNTGLSGGTGISLAALDNLNNNSYTPGISFSYWTGSYTSSQSGDSYSEFSDYYALATGPDHGPSVSDEDPTKPKPSGQGNNPNDLDPSTVGNNLLGLTYPGGNNPRTYSGKYSYAYIPSNLSEYPAIGHDRRYDNLGTAGFKGLISDTRAIGADWTFVGQELSIAGMKYLNPIDRIDAVILGVGLGLMAVPKTLLQISKPTGFMEIMVWYNYSSIGVTNRPSGQ